MIEPTKASILKALSEPRLVTISITVIGPVTPDVCFSHTTGGLVKSLKEATGKALRWMWIRRLGSTATVTIIERKYSASKNPRVNSTKSVRRYVYEREHGKRGRWRYVPEAVKGR